MSTPDESWDPYAVLGVSPQATQAEIERAWRRALRATHPDRNPDDAANRRVQEVLRAGEVLRDPERRARFDQRRNARRRKPRRLRPTWTTLPWDGGESVERVRVPGGVTIIHRRR